mmetsp:Transcript_37696/g.82595  ORF Transcript_37696/g.82595 Transcript_37696/m.82595 type:complete len:204 (-) Transcript_37696:9484-10095(-)
MMGPVLVTTSSSGSRWETDEITTQNILQIPKPRSSRRPRRYLNLHLISTASSSRSSSGHKTETRLSRHLQRPSTSMPVPTLKFNPRSLIGTSSSTIVVVVAAGIRSPSIIGSPAVVRWKSSPYRPILPQCRPSRPRRQVRRRSLDILLVLLPAAVAVSPDFQMMVASKVLPVLPIPAPLPPLRPLTAVSRMSSNSPTSASAPR